MELSGQISWWLCQAKPWKHGDPSIAELLIRFLWESKGMENPAWKPGIIPWCSGMTECDVLAYGRRFHTLFTSEKGEQAIKAG
jgi:hypothetical protein